MKMKRKKQLVRAVAACIAGLLAFVMLFGLMADLFFSAPSAAAASQSAVNDLKSKLKDSAAQKKKLEQELAGINQDKASVKSQIDTLDAQIANTEEQIELRANLIASLGDMIAAKEEELVAAQAKEQEQYEKFKSRVRVMYEQGDTSYLEVLLSSSDFSDFLSRYEIVSQIARYDKELFEELKTLKEEIAQRKLELEQDKSEEETAKSELESTKAQLDTQMKNREAAMRQLEVAADGVKESYSEIEAEEENIQAKIDKMVRELEEQAKKNNQNTTPVQVSGGYTYPLPSGYRDVSSSFGNRKHPVTGQYKLHTGVDIRAPRGVTIMAAKSGTVIIAGKSTAYGNYVVINHGGGLTTLYAHMSKLGTTQGAQVSAGDKIGEVGSTGYSTGNHLHFEVRVNGSYQDSGKILGLY